METESKIFDKISCPNKREGDDGESMEFAFEPVTLETFPTFTKCVGIPETNLEFGPIETSHTK